MRNIHILGSEFQSVDEIHEFLAEELDFPDYYGKNLDALYDCLTEIFEETHIKFSLSGVENPEIRRYLERIWYVLCDAADENLYLNLNRTEEGGRTDLE